MRNMDPDTPIEKRHRVMEEFAVKLKDSGYKTNERKEILKSGLTKFYRATEHAVAGGSISANRSRSELAGKRTLKAFQSQTWFAKRRGGKAVKEMKDDPWGTHTTHENGKGRRKNRKSKEDESRKKMKPLSWKKAGTKAKKMRRGKRNGKMKTERRIENEDRDKKKGDEKQRKQGKEWMQDSNEN